MSTEKVTIKSELKLPSGLVLKNRISKSAMTEGLADEFGRATPELARLYKTWADGDTGLFFTGNVQIDRRFLERPGNVVIDLDYGEQTEEQIARLKEWVDAGKSNGGAMIAQISQGGRQSNTLVSVTAIAPSAIKSQADNMPEVVEATVEQIERIYEKFVYAAKVCKQAGFDGIQIHAAHGYFLSSMLSPLANQRTDDFGGSLENRSSLLVKIVRGIREEVGSDFTVAVKLNSADFQKGGFSGDEATQVALMLAKEGLDLLELSGGNYEQMALFSGETGESKSDSAENKPKSTKLREAYFLKFSSEIIKALKAESFPMKVMVTGGFRSVEVMNQALADGDADVIGIGRPLCADPNCVADLLKGKTKELPRIETFWKLPGPLGFDFLQRYNMFAGMRSGGILMVCFKNLIEMGRSTFKGAQTNKKYPNLFSALMSQPKAEVAKAKALRGYKRDEAFLSKIVLENAN